MKKQGRRADPRRQRYWEDVVRRWLASGQSVRVFCRAEGLRESGLYFWRRELARRGRRNHQRLSAAVSRSAVPPARSAHDITPSFLPVHVVKPERAPGWPPVASGVEIILGKSRTVRVSNGFDGQTLADVLAVLEAGPC